MCLSESIKTRKKLSTSREAHRTQLDAVVQQLSIPSFQVRLCRKIKRFVLGTLDYGCTSLRRAFLAAVIQRWSWENQAGWNFRELCNVSKRSRCFPREHGNSRYIAARAFARKLLAIIRDRQKRLLKTASPYVRQAVMADVIFADETSGRQVARTCFERAPETRISLFRDRPFDDLWKLPRRTRDRTIPANRFIQSFARANLWTLEHGVRFNGNTS